MKIKKFKNIWTMGLILCCGMLFLIYIAKLFFPKFVVGVAEIPSIVQFGNYVDNHLWTYYLFNFTISMLVGYFYICACCRKKKLNKTELLIYTVTTMFIFVIQEFLYEYFQFINLVYLIVLPCVFCYIEKQNDIKYLYSTVTVFSIHSLAQILSLEIRDISTDIVHYNSATLTVLLIDVYIWLFLIYNYFNFKEDV